MLQIVNPFPQFNDLQGALLDAGNIYVGTANADPEVSPINVYWNVGLTQLAPQPLRTRGGVVVNNGVPSLYYTAAADYSMRVRDADGGLVWYIPSALGGAAASFQPLDSDLTAIAALNTQPFGRSLLTAASAAAARALLAIGNYLATAGGTMTGNILRSGAGPHTYHADATMTSGKITVTAPGASDPTSLNGEMWFEAT